MDTASIILGVAALAIGLCALFYAADIATN